MPSEAVRQLPPNPSLKLLGNLAKQLRKQYRSGEASALARIRNHHPAAEAGFAAPAGRVELTLRDAQLVVAREHGFEDWTELTRHIDSARPPASAPSTAGKIGDVSQIVPRLDVSDLDASLAHYVERLGFAMTREWFDEDQLSRCRVEHGSVAIVLQQPRGRSARSYRGRRGSGVRFACLTAGEDAHWPHHGHLTEIVDADGFTLLASEGGFSTGAPRLETLTLVLGVQNIDESRRFYVERLGCRERDRWEAAGRSSRCRLQLDEVTIVLQALDAGSTDRRGQGVEICLMCDDALAIYDALASRGVAAREPLVGNGLRVTSLSDPDGYRIAFESPTDAPEETTYADIRP